MRTSRRLRIEATSEAVTPAQYTVLVHLSSGPCAVGELAEAEQVRAPSMTRTVNTLEAAGFVTRRNHPEDGRLIMVELSDSGRSIIEETRRRRDKWLDQHISRLSPQDREILRQAAGNLLGLISKVSMPDQRRSKRSSRINSGMRGLDGRTNRTLDHDVYYDEGK